MTEFSSLSLAKPLLQRLQALGHTEATPIQAQMIPEILRGQDVIGIAQTGTGKTGAYLLPLLHGIEKFTPKLVAQSASVLVLVPTRELAAQVEESARSYGKDIRLSTAVVTGGVKHSSQERRFKRGVDVMIATPGRLEDHLGTGAFNMNGVTVVVLDEADQMLDLGFFPAIKRILGRITNDRQTILLSATMPPKIRELAREVLNAPVEISVARQGLPVEKIDQHVMHVLGAQKRTVLAGLLKELDVTSGMVFVRTKRGCDRVAEFLRGQGIAAVEIHGDLRQGQRDRALAAFKSGQSHILVATDVAARGLDIDGVSHVFNFELPNTPEAYVHRIGRTARAGAEGMAISLCDATERGQLRDIEKLIDRKLPVRGDAIGLELPSNEGKVARRGPRPGVNARRRARALAAEQGAGDDAATGDAFAGSKPAAAKRPRARKRGLLSAVGDAQERLDGDTLPPRAAKARRPHRAASESGPASKRDSQPRPQKPRSAGSGGGAARPWHPMDDEPHAPRSKPSAAAEKQGTGHSYGREKRRSTTSDQSSGDKGSTFPRARRPDGDRRASRSAAAGQPRTGDRRPSRQSPKFQ